MKRDSRSIFFVLIAASLSGCALGDLATDQSDWRDSVVANPTTEAGCFHAAYPDTAWERVACAEAPTSLGARAIHPAVTGDGSDYALEVAGPISRASGTFIEASGVISETSGGSATSYLLTLDTNLIANPAACQGGGGSACFGWESFLYQAFADGAEAFVYDTLIGYGSAGGSNCPATEPGGPIWASDNVGDCFLNSAPVAIPTVAVGDLATIKLGARVSATGNDVLVFAAGSDAYTTSAPDSETSLASEWTAIEFNIFGEGSDGANFNPGARLRLRVGVDDGSNTAPQCVGNGGEIAFTNNLNLGACEAFAGAEPSIEFTESD